MGLSEVFFLGKFFLFVNFKTYPAATGKNAVSLAKKIQSASKSSSVTVFLAVQAIDLVLIKKNVRLGVFAQHFDYFDQGPFTGSVNVLSLKAAGAFGSVLNHAEKKVGVEAVKKSLVFAKENKFPVLLCVDSISELLLYSGVLPKFVAFEPPELIGGDVSVSSAKPQVVKEFVKTLHELSPASIPLVGAGVKNSLDVKKSLEFGAKGVFVASGIVKAVNVSGAVKGLLTGFK